MLKDDTDFMCLQDVKSNNFPYIWPIKVLRFTVSIFFDMFYISSLAFFVLAANCKFIHAATPYWMPFPDVPCFATAHSIMFVVGLIMAAVAALIAWLMSVAATELDPDSKDVLAMANPRYDKLITKILRINCSVADCRAYLSHGGSGM